MCQRIEFIANFYVADAKARHAALLLGVKQIDTSFVSSFLVLLDGT